MIKTPLIFLTAILYTAAVFAEIPCGEEAYIYGSRYEMGKKSGSKYAMGKKGHVDVAKVYDDYKKTKEFHKYLQTKSFKSQKEWDRLKREGRLQEAERFDAKTHEELEQERDTLVKEVLADIDAAIKSFGKDSSYAFIIDGRCGNDGNDVTGEITDFMNRKYLDKG